MILVRILGGLGRLMKLLPERLQVACMIAALVGFVLGFACFSFFATLNALGLN